MKIGVISDVHGNLFALDKCLEFFHQQKTDRIIFLGDAVGYLPFGIEVLTKLKNNHIECISGNHEAMLLGRLPVKEGNEEVYKLSIVKNKLTPSIKNFVKSWKDFLQLELNGKLYLFVHGSPTDNLMGYVYPDTSLDEFADTSFDVVVMGHTHRPFQREVHGKIFINAGSCGFPRDAGNLACVLIIETVPFKATHYRIKLDIDRIISDIDPAEIHHSAISRLKTGSKEKVIGEIVN